MNLEKSCYYLFGFGKIPFYLHYFILLFIFYKPLSKLFNNKIFRIFLIFIPSILVSINLLRNNFYFQSDDFAHLKIAAEYSLGDIFMKGMINDAIWGFHHIFLGFWAFKFIYLFFGVRIEPYIIFNLILHLVNILLVFKIISKIVRSEFIAVLVSFAFSSYYLSWISNIHELVTGLFFFLSIYLWLTWLEKKQKIFWYLTLISYILSFSSKEITFIFPVLAFLASIVYNNYIHKINLKKTMYSLAPFFIILLLHFLLYDRVFLAFFRLESDGYKAGFSIEILVKNFSYYLTILAPIFNNSFIYILLFLLFAVLFDLLKHKLILIPILISYFLLLLPPSLFENKVAPYYTYLPSIFFYITIAILLRESYMFLAKYLKSQPKIFSNAFTVSFLLIILLGLFKSNRFFMDNCFLIQFPWPNPHKIALNSIVNKIDYAISKGELKSGKQIELTKNEATHEMKYLFTTNALYLFLKDKKTINYTFNYDLQKNSLLVEESSSYRKMSW